MSSRREVELHGAVDWIGLALLEKLPQRKSSSPATQADCLRCLCRTVGAVTLLSPMDKLKRNSL